MSELKENLDRFEMLAQRLLDTQSPSNTVANVRIDAGGMGVWIATTCCLITLAISVVAGVIGSIWISRELNRVDIELKDRKGENERMQSYLSSIFLRAPSLKPEDYDKKPKKE